PWPGRERGHWRNTATRRRAAMPRTTATFPGRQSSLARRHWRPVHPLQIAAVTHPMRVWIGSVEGRTRAGAAALRIVAIRAATRESHHIKMASEPPAKTHPLVRHAGGRLDRLMLQCRPARDAPGIAGHVSTRLRDLRE